MAFGRGKRVAVAAVAVGLLLIAGAGVAYREELVKRWMIWSGRAEAATRKKFSATRIKITFFTNWTHAQFIEYLSKESGVKFVFTPEAATLLSENTCGLWGESTESPEDALKWILAYERPDRILEYSLKGDTVVIGVRAKGPRDLGGARGVTQ